MPEKLVDENNWFAKITCLECFIVLLTFNVLETGNFLLAHVVTAERPHIKHHLRIDIGIFSNVPVVVAIKICQKG